MDGWFTWAKISILKFHHEYHRCHYYLTIAIATTPPFPTTITPPPPPPPPLPLLTPPYHGQYYHRSITAANPTATTHHRCATTSLPSPSTNTSIFTTFPWPSLSPPHCRHQLQFHHHPHHCHCHHHIATTTPTQSPLTVTATHHYRRHNLAMAPPAPPPLWPPPQPKWINVCFIFLIQMQWWRFTWGASSTNLCYQSFPLKESLIPSPKMIKKEKNKARFEPPHRICNNTNIKLTTQTCRKGIDFYSLTFLLSLLLGLPQNLYVHTNLT